MGRVDYINTDTGETSNTPPLLQSFADIACLMLQWRKNPSSVGSVALALTEIHEKSSEESARARSVWSGPYVDPPTSTEYWHCAATGRSCWGDPGMASDFIARVSERLK